MSMIELTPRQADVAKQLLLGHGNAAIAKACGVEIVTIKLHIRSMCQITQTLNRTHLALTLERKGIKIKEPYRRSKVES